MNTSAALNGAARRGRRRSWPPRLVLLSLVALGLSYGGFSETGPRLDLTAASATIRPTGWIQQPSIQVPRVGLDVATVNGQILAVGGFDPAKPHVFASVEAHQVTGNLPWRTITPMPTARANAAAAELGGAVYVAGGFTDEETVDVVERYDPATGSWSRSPALPDPRGAAGAASLGGLLYVAGGLIPVSPTEDQITASVVAFNPATQQWTKVAPMPTARWRLRLVAANGDLYAIGGQSPEGNTLSTVERYDPRSNTWTSVAPMNQDRGVPGVVAVNHGLGRVVVVVGGCQFVAGQLVSLRSSTEVYDLDTGKWRLLPAQLPHATCSLGAAADTDGTVLAIAGATADKGTVTATAEVDALTF
jgi:N-acetylneuraminic acid mutarotase